MTVQGVNQNQNGSVILPAAAGAVAGGLAGAFVPKMPFVPAKYSSWGDILKGVMNGDKIEFSGNLPENVKMERDALNMVTESTKEELKAIFGDKTEISVSDYLQKEFGCSKVEELKDAAKQSILKKTEALGGTLSEKELDTAADAAVATTKKIIDNAKDGKITKKQVIDSSVEACEDAMKSMGANVSESFDKLKPYLPKSKIKGAAIWGAIGAVVVGAIAYLMGSGKSQQEVSKINAEKVMKAHQG